MKEHEREAVFAELRAKYPEDALTRDRGPDLTGRARSVAARIHRAASVLGEQPGVLGVIDFVTDILRAALVRAHDLADDIRRAPQITSAEITRMAVEAFPESEMRAARCEAAITRAVAAERETCAKIAESVAAAGGGMKIDGAIAANLIAARIRERGK